MSEFPLTSYVIPGIFVASFIVLLISTRRIREHFPSLTLRVLLRPIIAGAVLGLILGIGVGIALVIWIASPVL